MMAKAAKRRRKRVHTCGGKRRFRDKTEAQQALQFLSTYGEREKSPVRVYFCDGENGCAGWHLTSKVDRWW